MVSDSNVTLILDLLKVVWFLLAQCCFIGSQRFEAGSPMNCLLSLLGFPVVNIHIGGGKYVW